MAARRYQHPTWDQLLEFILERVYRDPILFGKPPRTRKRGMDNVLRAIWFQGRYATRRETARLTGYRRNTVKKMVYLLKKQKAIIIRGTRYNRHYELNWRPT